jgi:hypothetical protein
MKILSAVPRVPCVLSNDGAISVGRVANGPKKGSQISFDLNISVYSRINLSRAVPIYVFSLSKVVKYTKSTFYGKLCCSLLV